VEQRKIDSTEFGKNTNQNHCECGGKVKNASILHSVARQGYNLMGVIYCLVLVVVGKARQNILNHPTDDHRPQNIHMKTETEH